jgi:hypothetical protein
MAKTVIVSRGSSCPNQTRFQAKGTVVGAGGGVSVSEAKLVGSRVDTGVFVDIRVALGWLVSNSFTQDALKNPRATNIKKAIARHKRGSLRQRRLRHFAICASGRATA